jgi:hypothetical protein
MSHKKLLGWLVLGSLLAGVVGAASPRAQEAVGLSMCPAFISADQRLVMEKWTIAGDCSKPTRTRVVDRFLGYVCVAEGSNNAKCRGFLPDPGSRTFDTSRHYRCINIDVTSSPEGMLVTRMKEWVAPQPKQCDWNPNLEILATEIDFTSHKVCISTLCIATERLSALGKVRLRQMIERSFRELGLVPEDSEAKTIIGTSRQLTKALSPMSRTEGKAKAARYTNAAYDN